MGLSQGKAPTQTAVTRTHPWLSLGLDHPSPTEVRGCLLASAMSEPLTVKRGAIPLPPFCPLLPAVICPVVFVPHWNASSAWSPALSSRSGSNFLFSDTVFQFFHVDYFVRVSVFS